MVLTACKAASQAEAWRNSRNYHRHLQPSILWLWAELPKQNLSLAKGLGLQGQSSDKASSSKGPQHHCMAPWGLPAALNDSATSSVQMPGPWSTEKVPRALFQNKKRGGKSLATHCLRVESERLSYLFIHSLFVYSFCSRSMFLSILLFWIVIVFLIIAIVIIIIIMAFIWLFYSFIIIFNYCYYQYDYFYCVHSL